MPKLLLLLSLILASFSSFSSVETERFNSIEWKYSFCYEFAVVNEYDIEDLVPCFNTIEVIKISEELDDETFRNNISVSLQMMTFSPIVTVNFIIDENDYIQHIF